MTPDRQSNNRDDQDIASEGPGRDDWGRRCSVLFEEMRRPARAMVARAYGRAMSDHEIEDVYAAAWAATLSALRDRGRRMADEELRAYILTAVASHASKEMRRRGRKPTSPLQAEKERVISDGHSPLPDEIALGSEERRVARDLLASLPERRRAVMLLRYGWGLSPDEVCALVPSLSPRAYRKEVTRGVEQLIESLRSMESGHWCRTREPLIRDLIAGTADDATRRQALNHLDHCQACSELATRLRGNLHEVGGTLGIASIAGSVGAVKLGLLDRLAGLVGDGRSFLFGSPEKVESSAVLASGAAKGSGAAVAGAAAKLAGVGGAGKATLACLGTGVAATACVAAGVIPGLSLDDGDEPRPVRSRSAKVAVEPPRSAIDARTASRSVEVVTHAVAESGHSEPPPDPPQGGPPEEPSLPAPVESNPVPTPVQEFDPVASTVAPSGSSPTPETVVPPASESSGSSTSVAQDEFGP